jgi:hypothetical protein
MGHKAIEAWLTKLLRSSFIPLRKCQKRKLRTSNKVKSLQRKNSNIEKQGTDELNREDTEDENEDESADTGDYGGEEQDLTDLIGTAIANILPSDDQNKCYNWLQILIQNQLHSENKIQVGMTTTGVYDINRKSTKPWGPEELDMTASSNSKNQKKQKKDKSENEDLDNNISNKEAFVKKCAGLKKVDVNALTSSKYRLNDDNAQFGIWYLNYRWPNDDIFIFHIVFYNYLYKEHKCPSTFPHNYIKCNPFSYKILIVPILHNDHYSLILYIRPDLLVANNWSDKSCILTLDSINDMHIHNNLKIKRINR